MEKKAEFNDKVDDPALFSSQELNKYVYVKLTNDKALAKAPPVAIRPKILPQIHDVPPKAGETLIIKPQSLVSPGNTVTISKISPNPVVPPAVMVTKAGSNVTIHNIPPKETLPVKNPLTVSMADRPLSTTVLQSFQKVTNKLGSQSTALKKDETVKPISLPLKTKKLVVYNQPGQSYANKTDMPTLNTLRGPQREDNKFTLLAKPIISPNNSATPFSLLKEQAQVTPSSVPVLSINNKLQISNGTIRSVNFTPVETTEDSSDSEVQVIKVTDCSAKENQSPPEITLDSLKTNEVLEPSPTKVESPSISPVQENPVGEPLKKPENCPILTNSNSKVIIKTDSITVRKKLAKDRVSPEVDVPESQDTMPVRKGHHSRKARVIQLKKKPNESDILRCNSCGCYGVREDFIIKCDLDFCSESCSQEYKGKESKTTPELTEKHRKRRSKIAKTPDVIERLEPIELPESPVLVLSSPFSWETYLEGCCLLNPSMKAAPHKIWTDPFIQVKYNLKPRMKLEGIDPHHQSMFCVMTAVEVIGPRVRLHFDGFPQQFDFWSDVSSSHLFPVGWCKENNRHLHTPPGTSNFIWKAYLKHTKCIATSKAALPRKPQKIPNLFEPGMKLEAEDRKNNWTCVATVVDSVESQILVNFDGWGSIYDIWFDVDSPYIHPVGYCQSNGVKLYPPNNYHNIGNFDWGKYLKEQKAKAAPNCIFKPRRPRDFRVNMKVELFDKRNPTVLRVATIVAIEDFRLKIHFDGWDDCYDYWVDDNTPDIHPPGWAAHTGYPLQAPLPGLALDVNPVCETVQCKGIGHVNTNMFRSHHTSHGCPYSIQNISKDWDAVLPDRLEHFHKGSDQKKALMNLTTGKLETLRSDLEASCKRIRKRRRFFDELPDLEEDPPLKCAKITENPIKIEPLEMPPSSPESDPSSKIPCHLKVHQEIFNPVETPTPLGPCKASRNYAIDHIMAHESLPFKNLENLTKLDVSALLAKIPGCSEYIQRFFDEDVDGSALGCLDMKSLVTSLGMRIGPAVKLFSVISRLKE